MIGPLPSSCDWRERHVQGTASLVTLLQQLTENVVGLIESLAVEKESISSEMVHVAEENQLLQSQVIAHAAWWACIWHALLCAPP